MEIAEAAHELPSPSNSISAAQGTN